MEIYGNLLRLLKLENEFIDDTGALKTQVVVSAAMNGDEGLLRLLLRNEQMRAAFFREVAGCLLFEREKFLRFVEQKRYLQDSYTAYRQKIGLVRDGEFLKQNNDVELVWPYKDCVLEGGQTREEQKRDEIFFNETLAQDEITQLFEPKVLTGARRYDGEGEHPLSSFRRDADINERRGLPPNTITDNLVIKGNNLLALHSIEKEFAGKVKLIYIDPPFNTERDSFKYFDNFKRSSWLTFMQNRLLIAKNLLRNDGAIFIECDKNEAAYLKVLLDEIFGEDNFVSDIAVQTSYANGLKVSQKEKTILKMKDTIFVYKKQNLRIKPQYVERRHWDTHYDRIIITDTNGRVMFKSLKEELVRLGIIDRRETITKQTIDNASFFKFICEHKDCICCLNPIHSKGEMKDAAKQAQDEIVKFVSSKGHVHYLYNGREVGFLSQCFHTINGNEVYSMILGDIWTDIDFGNNQNEGGVDFPEGKKPERLLYRIIDMLTEEGDIVLDYFGGCGTTGAVAHKMNRQYIMCEQMEHQINLQLTRLPLVIGKKGINCYDLYDRSGISKSVHWHGGGSFVYVELKKYNEAFVERIMAAKGLEELLAIWEDMKKRSFLNYNVDLKRQEEALEDFKALSVEEQKRALCDLLDKNQLYVNLSSMEDEVMQCGEEEKTITKDFYRL